MQPTTTTADNLFSLWIHTIDTQLSGWQHPHLWLVRKLWRWRRLDRAPPLLLIFSPTNKVPSPSTSLPALEKQLAKSQINEMSKFENFQLELIIGGADTTRRGPS